MAHATKAVPATASAFMQDCKRRKLTFDQGTLGRNIKLLLRRQDLLNAYLIDEMLTPYID
jgi:hypothetical protein